MNIVFTANAWEDFSFWLENNSNTTLKIKELIKSIKQSPFKEIGIPEPLKYGLKGFWSRRITSDHRLVYKISGKKGIDQKCTITSCRFHYDSQ